MASKNNARGMVARQASNNSLGMISEDGAFGGDPFGFEDDEEDFKRRDLFHNELSVVDGHDSIATPTGSSVFIDLEAEERSFVTGSQLYLDAMETIKQLKQRLIRRTSIIDEIRKYYLRDVVTVKHILKDVLTTRERQQVLKMYDENLPSIDLKAALALHAPTKCEMQVSQCGECGGQLEIIMKDSNEVDMLKKTIIDCKDRESRFRIKLATLDAQIENATRERGESNKTHAEEKKFLYTEMKKVKAEAEKVHKNLETMSTANKRLLAENGTLQSRLNSLGSAAQQLEQGSQEIANLRAEVDELSVALKTARFNEKHAVKELNDHHLELKAQKLKNEEHVETINTLVLEKGQLNHELAVVGEQVKEWTTTAHLTSEQLREEQERRFDLDTEHTQLKHERDELLDMLNSADDSGIKKDLLEAREEGKELREENRRLKKDHERVKRQLEKAQEAKLVLEHDLAVAIHEQKEQEAELHSITDYLHAKVSKDAPGGVGGEPMEDVIRSMKMNARAKVGEKPQPSARVATFKSRGSEAQLQLELVGSTSRAASRGSARGEGNDNEEEDNNGSDNEGEPNDGEENENEGEDGNDDATTEKRGRSKTAKRAGNRKSKSPHPNKDTAGSGSASPNKRVRRPSMDNIGKFPASASTAKSGVSLTTLAAAKKTATAVKGKSTNKTAKKRRGSFVGVADKPDAGEESEHDDEVEGEGDDGGADEGTKKVKRTSTEPSKPKRGKTTTKMRRGSFSGEPEPPVPTSASASTSRPTSKSENRASPTKAKKSSKSAKSVTSEDAAQQDGKVETHSDDEQVGSGDEEGYSDADERDYDHAHDHDPEEIDGVYTVPTPRVKRSRSSSPSKRPSSNTQLRKSRDFDSNDGTESRGASREGSRTRRGSVMADARPNSKNIKAAAEEGAVKKRQVNVKKVNVNLSDSAKIKTKPVVPKVVKQVRKVKKSDPGASTSAAEETEEVEQEEEEEEVEVEVEEESGDEEEQIEQTADDDGELEGVEEGTMESTAEGTENGDEAGNNDAEQEEDVDTFVDAEDAAPVTPPRALSRQSSNHQLQKQNSLPKKKVPPVTSPDMSRASPVPNSTQASRRGSIGGALPLPKRRRSIPKSFSFLRQSLSTDHNASSNFSVALAAVNAAHNPQPMQAERKEELKADFAEGAFRSEEPRSIADEDDDPKDRAHTKFVPIIPIEVRRYVADDKTPKKKFVPTKEEVVVLEPLTEDASPFETALRGELLKAMKLFPTAKESEVNKMLNASREVLHKFCTMFSTTLESNWASLQAARTALDLHYVVKHVIEGMAATCDVKSGNVELADICKKILPIAGTSLAGPAVTLRWQEEVHLNDVLLTSLLPVVDGATGKIGTKEMSDFFNSKMLHPTSKVRGANNLVLEKIVCANENAQLMQSYAASTNALVTDKLTTILKDWAKAKAAYYDMDNKIAQEKDKVRKILEARIGDLTKEKTNLGVLCSKHETRIKALEHTESELVSAQKTIKTNLTDLDEKKATIEEFESAVTELHHEIDALKEAIAKKSEQMGLLEAQIVVMKQEEGKVQVVLSDKDRAFHRVMSEKMEVTEERDHFQAQYERMLAQEDSRLNKLVSVYMQVEPLVQDLAIQTEFVAPPMNLRTMVASKNARGKKAPLIFSQSLEVPPSDPGALTSTMVDSASSTYNPLSSHIAAVITARTPQGFPFTQSPDLNSSTTGGVSHLNTLSGSAGGVGASLYHTNTLSARSNMSVESRLGGTQFPSSPTLRQRHALSREDSRQSREDSFFLNAADFLAAAPINYELSSRNLMPVDSIQEISRLLAPDDASITSSRSHHNLRVGNTSHASQASHTSHTGKIHRKKALKLTRLTNASADPHAGSSGQYHHVHNEDKIPEWGSIHASGPVKSANIDPHVVLGISGVSNLVGQSKPSLSDSRNSAFAGHNVASGAVSSQGSNAAVRMNNRNASTKNSSSELEVGLPEVKVQAYHIPTSQPYANPNNYNVNPQHASNFRAVSLQNANAPNFSDSAYFGSNPTSRGSHNSFGLGSTSPSEKEYMRQSEQMYLMLDSPSLGGQSGYPNFDFEKDRKDPLRIAGDLPSSQESVKGIIYNNRNPNSDQFRLEEPQGQEFSKNDASPASVGQNSVPSTHGSQTSTAASTKANTQANSGKQVSGARGANPKNNPSNGTNNPGGTHNAVGNMNEEVLKRLRKELLSR